MTLHTFADGSIGPLNHPSPFDAAWRTRVPSSWPSDDKPSEPKRRIGSSSGWDCRAYSPIGEERKAALAAMTAKARDVETAAAAKPFRFEDLNGQPEPGKWGPTYDIKRGRKPVAQAVREANERWWRNDPPFKSNSASGQAGEFNAKKYRGQVQAAFMAQCAKDKRDWAAGIGPKGQTIVDAYKRAMAEKRARLAREALAEAA